MANRILDTRLGLKYDTAANWATENPVLLAGEVGIEKDTLLSKVGDGKSTWQQLPYKKAAVAKKVEHSLSIAAKNSSDTAILSIGFNGERGLLANFDETYFVGSFSTDSSGNLDKTLLNISLKQAFLDKVNGAIRFDIAQSLTDAQKAQARANIGAKDTDTGATSVEVTGSGNAVTGASYSSSTRKLTLTKGTTFQEKLTAGTNITITDNIISAKDTTYTFTPSNPTLAWNTESTIGTIGGVVFKVKMPANPNTDTGATSVEVTGTGNAFTAASYNASTRKITFTKGTTFLTAHQAIKTLKTDNAAAQSTSSGEAISGSGTINLHKVSKTGSYNDLLNRPTKLSDFTDDKVVKFTNTNVAASAFVADNNYSNYGYCASIGLNGVTANDTADVYFSGKQVEQEIYASFCESYAGGVKIYAAEKPSEAVIIPLILIHK